MPKTIPADLLARAEELTQRSRSVAARARAGAAPANAVPTVVISGNTATIRLYDSIDDWGGAWGISAEEFAEALDAAVAVERIELRINSGGGLVWEAFAIANLLRSHSARVVATIDGLAASAASFIAATADEVVMMPNAQMMIHDAMGACWGQAADMLDYAAFLDDASDNIASVYAARNPDVDWRALMRDNGVAGTWYGAEEAVEIGLADRVFSAEPAATATQVTSEAAEVTQLAADVAEVDEDAARLAAYRHRHNAHKVA